MPAPSATELVTLSDIAALAHVQRPVVTIWRSRRTRGDAPFPPAVTRHDGREVFRLGEVVDWLEGTSHGNNPAARQDAAAAAALDLLPPDERSAALDGLIALLALKAKVGTPLRTLEPADLLDLADEVDPDDACLYSEIAALGRDAAAWAAHADDLASAAYTPAGAVESLVAQHRRLGMTVVTEHSLAPTGEQLVARLVAALAADESGALGALAAPFGEAELLLAVGAATGEPGAALLPTPGTPAARHARRLLLAAGWAIEDAGRSSVTPSAALALLPSATQPGRTAESVLDALGEVEATLPPDGRALVLGPAAVLCDRLPHRWQSVRATFLRSGRVRAVVRLPAALRPARTRERLGLWLLAPGPTDVRMDSHRTATADLGGTRLDPTIIEDLVTDLVAALPGSTTARGHAFRFTRLTPTTALIAAAGALVVPGAPARRPRTDAVEAAASITATYASLGDGVASLASRHIVPGQAAGPVTVTLGRLADDGRLRLIRGNRIDPADLMDGTGVTVHTAAALAHTNPGTTARIDRLHLAGAYPRSRFTEPGDVVFTTAPAPAAAVDRDGLAVIASPARALRLTPAASPGLLPEVIAHAIASAPPGTDWRAIPVPLLPAAQAAPLRDALTEITAARARAAARLDALAALATQLVEGTSTGSITLLPPELPPTGTAQMEG
jgi:hypothetical protein